MIYIENQRTGSRNLRLKRPQSREDRSPVCANPALKHVCKSLLNDRKLLELDSAYI